MLDSLVVFVVSFLIGTLGIHVGALGIAGVADHTHAVVTWRHPAAGVTPRVSRSSLGSRCWSAVRPAIGRRDFVLAEFARGVGLIVCSGLYREGWVVVAATLVPVAVWPGVFATIKRFRDLGHDPLLILPVLMYSSAGFAVGYQFNTPVVSGMALGVYLLYVGCVDRKPDAFGSEEPAFDV